MEPSYLYHSQPENMVGSVLFPMNVLKETMPDVYEMNAKKYQGREYLLDDVIPILNCKWNDVLHLTAVQPKKLVETLRSTGHHPPPLKFFQIDPTQLSPTETVIYWYRYDTRDSKFKSDNFERFSLEKLGECALIPEATIDYYQKKNELKQKPLLFHRIPHILYRGSIDTSGLPVINA